MAKKINQILKNRKVIIMLLVLLFAIWMIPSYKGDGVEITYIASDSPFKGTLDEGMIIREMQGTSIASLEDYAPIMELIKPNDTVSIVAGKQFYEKTAATDSENPEHGFIGLRVKEPSNNRLELGLDLQGGARVVLSPITAEGVEFNDTVFDTTTQVLMTRLNAYALKNVVIRQIQDIDDNRYIIIEMPGEGSEKVVELVKSVGKFELRILNETVFTGDSIIPPIGLPTQDFQTGQWRVSFTINNVAAGQLRDSFISKVPEAPSTCSSADDCTEGFSCSRGFAGSGMCLPSIEMFLDDQKTFSAPPAQSLYETWKFGEASKNLVVETNTQESAKQVEVVLEAGRLPTQIKSLNIISQDYVDPKLGRDFLNGAAIAGLAAIIAVGLVILVRYRSLKIAIPIMFTGIAEVVIILGVASLIKWSIDLPAIAGIIAAVGTGVEHQIIITDELLRGRTGERWAIKKQTKVAFGIIVAAVLTTAFAMLPLMYPGFTGLYTLRGFAIVTIIGVMIGYLITRPAYAAMAEILLSEK